MEEPIYFDNPEVMTYEQRLAELEGENLPGREFMSRQLAEIIQNPGALKQKFNLTSTQAMNVSSVLTAASAGLTHKYLARHFGHELAGALGGLLGGIVARKVIGG